MNTNNIARRARINLAAGIASLLLLGPAGTFHVTAEVPLMTIVATISLFMVVIVSGQFLWYRALEITSATRVSIAILFSPIIGTAYAIFLMGETLSFLQAMGGLLITAGLGVIQLHVSQVKDQLMHKFHLQLRHIHHP